MRQSRVIEETFRVQNDKLKEENHRYQTQGNSKMSPKKSGFATGGGKFTRTKKKSENIEAVFDSLDITDPEGQAKVSKLSVMLKAEDLKDLEEARKLVLELEKENDLPKEKVEIILEAISNKEQENKNSAVHFRKPSQEEMNEKIKKISLALANFEQENDEERLDEVKALVKKLPPSAKNVSEFNSIVEGMGQALKNGNNLNNFLSKSRFVLAELEKSQLDKSEVDKSHTHNSAYYRDNSDDERNMIDSEVIKSLTESIRNYERRCSKLEAKNDKLEKVREKFENISKVVCSKCDEVVHIDDFNKHSFECKGEGKESKVRTIKQKEPVVSMRILNSILMKTENGMPYLVSL